MVKHDVPMRGWTNRRTRRGSVWRRWRPAGAALCAMTLAMCFVPAACAVTDEQAEMPPQPSNQIATSKRAIPAITQSALFACADEGAKRLSRHTYDISFEAQATATRVLAPVEPVGNRLDDAELEKCMIRALEAMPVYEIQPDDDSAPATSQRVLPHVRGLIGNTAVLPQVIRLIPIVIAAPGGITIVVTVTVVIAVAAVAGGKMTKDCQKQWKEAREYCDELLATRNPSRDLTGGYTNREDCARGHVDERCGGNRVDWGDRGRSGRRY